LSPKNEVKEMFRLWFKKNNTVGYVMSKQDIVKNILTKLNAKQESSLQEAINELKTEGLIEVKEDGVTLVLIKKV
jgi:transcriptional regulator of NAD metabolism